MLYDPGIGELGTGEVFRGWTFEEQYSETTVSKTIVDVRDTIKELFNDESNPIKEGDTLDVYAMLFKIINIEYVSGEANDITLGTDSILRPINSEFDSAAYTVNMAYTPDADQKFDGWNVYKGSSNIAGYKAGNVYTNGTEIMISGDVTFSVNAPHGHWLVFDENGKGATYNAPQFVKSGEVTKPNSIEMTRKGYTFDGWYTGAPESEGGDPTGDKFSFGESLLDNTTIYAKWIPASTATYSVLIWLQNLEDKDKYDFKESVQLEGSVGTIINTVQSSGTGKDAYAIVNGQDKKYTGFHLEKFDENIEIVPEGSTVLNIYYDRTEYTLSFYKQLNSYEEIFNPYHDNLHVYGRTGSSYTHLTWSEDNNAWGYYTYSWGRYRWNTYSGKFYTPKTQLVKTITGVYEESIKDQFPIVGTDGVTYRGYTLNAPESQVFDRNTYIPLIDIILAEDTKFILLNLGNGYSYYFNYYFEALPGETGTIEFQNKKFRLPTTAELHSSSSSVYSTKAEDFASFVGFTQWKSNPEYDEDGRADFDNENTMNLYYERNKYPLVFMDGIYVDGDDKPIEAQNLGKLDEINDIYFEQDIRTYSTHKPDSLPKGYVLEGWYADKACTTPYEFETMPIGGVTVYAKWRQIQYRVFLHPQKTQAEAPNLDWGSDNQKMAFRVSYEGKVSLPMGRIGETEEMIGWYRDAECTDLFNGESTKLTDDIVHETPTYDKTKDFTDPMDKWGAGATSNEDVNREWITRKLDLYASWRAKIDGAEGINVIYVTGDGHFSDESTEYIDPLKYKDRAGAVGYAAPIAPENQAFRYWILQTWNGTDFIDTGKIVYPGDAFEVLVANSKVEELPTDQQTATITKRYTVQLRAEYGPAEAPTPTHIYWYGNNGTGAMKKSLVTGADGKETENLQINEAVDIKPANTFEYKGHNFLGWARVEESDGADQLLTEDDLYIKWNGSKFLAKDSEGKFTVEVTKVAADEVTPYHDMYAVWGRDEIKLTIQKELAGNIDYIEIPKTFKMTVTINDTSKEIDKLTSLNPNLNFNINDDKSSATVLIDVKAPKSVGKESAESAVLTLLGGMTYEVEEQQYTGFTVTYKNQESTTGIETATTVYVTNTAAKITPAGLDIDTVAAKTALLSLFAFAMMCALGFSLKRRYVSRR